MVAAKGDFAVYIGPADAYSDLSVTITGKNTSNVDKVYSLPDYTYFTRMTTTYGDHLYFTPDENNTLGWWTISVSGVSANSTKLRTISNIRFHATEYQAAIYLTLLPLCAWKLPNPVLHENSDYTGFVNRLNETSNELWDCCTIYTTTTNPTTNTTLIYDHNGLAFNHIAGVSSASAGDWYITDGLHSANTEKIVIDMAE